MINNVKVRNVKVVLLHFVRLYEYSYENVKVLWFEGNSLRVQPGMKQHAAELNSKNEICILKIWCLVEMNRF